MDPKTIAFGLAVVAASIGGSVAVQTKDVVAVSAGEADVAVTEIAKLDPELQGKTCTRTWAQVNDSREPTLGWVCNEAWVPATQQAWLDKTAGEDGQSIELKPRDDGKGGIVVDATVTKGEAPVYQAPPVESVKPVDEPKGEAVGP